MSEKEIEFDPRVFILPPFYRCPKCQKESFGVLMITPRRFTRRCRECWYAEHYALPELKKTVIYIDQFAISEMMKALNPQTKANKAGRVDPFWLELFKQLDSLSKCQLIVCPDSSAHSEESVLSPFNAALRRMYQLLSHNVNFKSPVTIQLLQMTDHLNGWIRGTPHQFTFDPESIVAGGPLHGWTDRIMATADLEWRQEWIDEVRAIRDQLRDNVNTIFARWQTETDKKFEYWFNLEANSYGLKHLYLCIAYYNRLGDVLSGKLEPLPEYFRPIPSVEIFLTLKSFMENSGVAEQDVLNKVKEYLTSPSLKEIPFLKISSMMWAGLARQAAHGGRKKPPSSGMTNDIKTISTLLPYCDAMFLDNECQGLLNDEPLRSEVNSLGTQIFSFTNKEDFVSYLDGIKRAASADHLNLLKSVYGDHYDKPYTSLYNPETN